MRIADCITLLLSRYPQTSRFVIGFSGGKDSTVLLHALQSFVLENKLPVELIAVHINHGLSANAQSWVEHCQSFCDNVSVPLYVHVVRLDTEKESIEQVARKARYDIFENYLSSSSSVVLTAHHLQDQIETVLMRLFEGAGLKGLSGIPSVRRHAKGEIFRPFLQLSPNDIDEYVAQFQLSFIQDESNLDTAYHRNYIRQNILPLVYEKWPQVLSSVESSREFIVASQSVEADLSASQLNTVQHSVQSCNHKNYKVIELIKLKQIDKRYWHTILRSFIGNHEQVMPRQTKMVEYLRQLTFAQSEHDIAGEFKYYQLRYYNGLIYLLTGNDISSVDYFEEVLMKFSKTNPVNLLPDKTIIKAVFDKSSACDEIFEFTIKQRQGGERYISNQGQSREVKKLLNEYKIEPWLRDRIPFVYYQGQLVSIPGVWILPDLRVGSGEFINFIWSDSLS